MSLAGKKLMRIFVNWNPSLEFPNIEEREVKEQPSE